MANKRWTPEEENILLGYIKSNIHNIHKGIVEAAKELNRTEVACRLHWYGVLSKKDATKYGVTYITLSNEAYIKNKKVSSKPLPINKNIISKVKKFIIKLLSL